MKIEMSDLEKQILRQIDFSVENCGGPVDCPDSCIVKNINNHPDNMLNCYEIQNSVHDLLKLRHIEEAEFMIKLADINKLYFKNNS